MGEEALKPPAYLACSWRCGLAYPVPAVVQEHFGRSQSFHCFYFIGVRTDAMLIDDRAKEGYLSFAELTLVRIQNGIRSKETVNDCT